jgi:hypothetical protein
MRLLNLTCIGTYNAECRGDELPAVFHVGVDAESVHHLNVVIETVGTCKQK